VLQFSRSFTRKFGSNPDITYEGQPASTNSVEDRENGVLDAAVIW